MNADSVKTVSAAGLLVTLGIIFGDIGTSPLYVLSAIVGTRILPPKHARFATSDWVKKEMGGSHERNNNWIASKDCISWAVDAEKQTDTSFLIKQRT